MALQRLDYLVAKNLGVSRSIAVELIESSKVKVGKVIKSKPSLKFDEEVRLNVSYKPKIKSLKFDIEIIYEDENCVVINKPAGLLSHSKGVFSSEGTVASWLMPKTKGFKDTNRAGIVHRLDRGTSGVMLCAKNPDALAHFQKQFSKRNVKKRYFALVSGALEPAEAIVDIPIERNPKDPKRFKASANGKPAITSYKVTNKFKKNNMNFNLVELFPKTGRTHQLRVHLAYLKHPIVGDEFYNGLPASRLYLHAHSLEITMPNSERKKFASDLPASFLKPKIVNNG